MSNNFSLARGAVASALIAAEFKDFRGALFHAKQAKEFLVTVEQEHEALLERIKQLQAGLIAARDKVQRIYSHYSSQEVAEAHDGSQLGDYRDALKMLASLTAEVAS